MNLRLVLDCVSRLNRLDANNTVKLIWAPAHAHRLTKDGMVMTFIELKPVYGIADKIPKQEIKTRYWHQGHSEKTPGRSNNLKSS